MKYCYRKYKEHHLFVIKYKGNFSFEVYKESVTEYLSISNYQAYNLMIIDLREVTLEKKVAIVDHLVSERKSEKLLDIKIAYLVDNPKITAILELYTSHIQNQNYKYFSTFNGIFQHLHIAPSKHKEIENYLSNN